MGESDKTEGQRQLSLSGSRYSTPSHFVCILRPPLQRTCTSNILTKLRADVEPQDSQPLRGLLNGDRDPPQLQGLGSHNTQ